MSSQILRHVKNDFDILFLQEINHAPILPHVYAYSSGSKATIVSNISQDKHSRGEHGSVLVCSPLLARFVTPLPRLDTEGLLAAAVLTLPGAPPTLLVSVYARSAGVHRSKIENILRPLMHQYPNHVLGGDTNCIMCPELDGANPQTDNEWPWLRRQVSSDPPRLIDTFRHFHPIERSFSRYPTPYRASSSRLDHILLSPAASEYFAPKQLRQYHSPDDLSWDDWRLSDSEVERIDLENAANQEEADKIEEMTADEMAVDGYYPVAGIARHEYKQGWKFLTLWDGYGLSEATWEPTSAFIQPDGRINPIFRSYLVKNNEGQLLTRAETLSQRKRKN